MKKVTLTQDGLLKVPAFEVPLANFTDDTTFQVLDAKEVKIYDDGKPTDMIDHVEYRILVNDLCGQIVIRVTDSKKIILPKSANLDEDEIFLKINTQNVVLHPQSVTFGKVKFSVLCSAADIAVVS